MPENAWHDHILWRMPQAKCLGTIGMTSELLGDVWHDPILWRMSQAKCLGTQGVQWSIAPTQNLLCKLISGRNGMTTMAAGFLLCRSSWTSEAQPRRSQVADLCHGAPDVSESVPESSVCKRYVNACCRPFACATDPQQLTAYIVQVRFAGLRLRKRNILERNVRLDSWFAGSHVGAPP